MADKLGGPGSIVRPDLGLAVLPDLSKPGQGTVGFQMAPMAPVAQPTGTFRTYDFANLANKNVNQLRASGDLPAPIQFSQSETSWATLRYALRDVLDEDDMACMGGDRAMSERAVVASIARQLALQHEARMKTIGDTLSNTSSPSVKWDAASSTTIRANLDTAIQSVVDSTYGFVTANTFTCDYKVIHALRKASELTSLVAGAHKLDELTDEMVVSYLHAYGFTHVNVSTTGQLGQNVYIHHTPEGEIMDLKTTFSTFVSPVVKTNTKVWQWNEAGILNWYAAQIEVDELLVHDDAGYLLSDVLT